MTATLVELLKLTLFEPKRGAEAVLSMGFPRQILWAFLALATVLSVFMVQAMTIYIPTPDEVTRQALPFQSSPLLFALITWGSLVLVVFCIYYIGRAFGGQGTFDDSLLALVWLQFLLMVCQVGQFILGAVSVALSALLGVLFMPYWVWIAVSFITVLHGFKHRGNVLGGVIVSFVGLMFGMSVLLGLIMMLLGVEIPNA